MKVVEVINAFGHENIRATHRSTFEITKEKKLSVRGDCIVAVSADKSFQDFKSEFKEFLRKDSARVIINIDAGRMAETIYAFGCSKLVLAHPTDLVVRKSDYVCDRTLAIKADKAACDFSRELVAVLQNPSQKVRITITVEV
ncbi:MAG: DUF371 domain-containing protein [Candidatus Bathyarchaeia archaeon]|nr:DUF371 domain-containing protein [Candidatus Bathyarchaeota archaeon]